MKSAPSDAAAVRAWALAHPEELPEPLRGWVLPWRDDPAVMGAWADFAASLAAVSSEGHQHQGEGRRGPHHWFSWGKFIAWFPAAKATHARFGFTYITLWYVLSWRIRLRCVLHAAEKIGTAEDVSVIRDWIAVADGWWTDLATLRSKHHYGSPLIWGDPEAYLLGVLGVPWEKAGQSHAWVDRNSVKGAHARFVARVSRAWGAIPDTDAAEAGMVKHLAEVAQRGYNREVAASANTPDDLFYFYSDRS